MVYCEGANCNKRNTCRLHNGTKVGETYQYIDYSTYGSGCFDSKGKCEIKQTCGDGSKAYPYYEPNATRTNRIKLSDIRKEPYETWCHYKYEDYNVCPICGGNLHMSGQINQYQNFNCINCGKEFTLNAFTEEVIFIDNK